MSAVVPFRLSLLYFAIFILVAPVFAARTAEVDYNSRMEISLVEYNEGKDVTVEVLNRNEEAPTTPQSRQRFSAWVALPPDSRIEYEFQNLEWMIYWNDGSSEGPLQIDENSSTGTVPNALTFLSTQYPDRFRGVGMANCTFGITQTVAAGADKKGTAVLNHALVKLTFTGGTLDEKPWPENLAERDPFLLEMGKELCVNAEQIPFLVRREADLPDLEKLKKWDTLLKRASTEAPIVLFKIARPGLYSLSSEDLDHMGIDPNQYTGNRIRFYAGNRPLQTVNMLSSASSFNLTVYVPESEFIRSPYIPIWMLQLPIEDGNGPSTKNLFASSIKAPQTTSPHLSSEVEIFKPLVYNRHLSYTEKTGHWAVAKCGVNEFVRLPFDIRGVNSEGEGELKVSLNGFYPHDEHLVELYINGTMIGERESFISNKSIERTFKIPGNVLQEGRNVLVFHFPEENKPRLAREVALNWATVRYPVDPNNFPINRKVRYEGPEESSTSVTILRTDVDNRTQGFMVDVTNELEPQVYTARMLRTADGQDAFNTTISCEGKQREYYFSDTAGIHYLSDASVWKYEDLLSPDDGTDYLIIAHPELSYAMEKHANRRTRQGLRTRILKTDSIYAIFSFGYLRYEPIADAIRHAYNAWPGKRLSQVLLVGEASEYWWEKTSPRNDVSRNMLPVYGFADQSEHIRGDDNYGTVSGDGALTDLEIGRFSASTPEEVSRLIRYVENYETNPPVGPWLDRHVFFTDDEPEFAKVTDNIIQADLSSNSATPVRLYLQDMPYEDYFRIYTRKRSPEMTERIIEEYSRGALTATYAGHGGPNLWSAERIFHYRDIERLKCGDKRPIMTAASCDTAWVDYPIDPVRQSIGEQFLLSEDGGGIALFAPVSGANSLEHDYLLRPFFSAINEKGFDHLGKAAMFAKLNYLLERNQIHLTRQFILLGDPALKIPHSSNKISLSISPSVVYANQTTTLQISGKVSEIVWGKVEAWLMDDTSHLLMPPIREHFSLNAFELKMPIPAFTEAGDYRLVINAYNEAENQYETLNYQLEILEPEIELEWRSNPPVEQSLPAGTPIDVELHARNKTESYVPGVKLSIRDLATNTVLTTQTLVLNAGSDLNWNFPFTMAEGISVLEARADYLNQQPGQDSLAVASLELLGTSKEHGTVSVPGGLVQIHRTYEPPKTKFNVPLYNLSEDDLKTLTAELFILDTQEGTPVGRKIFIGRIPKGKSSPLEFIVPEHFPEGELPFRLKVSGTVAESNRTIDEVLTFPVTIGPVADIAIVPGSIRVNKETYITGETVFVSATVRNRGKEIVDNIRNTLYLDLPWSRDSIANAANNDSEFLFRDPLMPGEERDVRLRWDPTKGDPQTPKLYLVTNSERSYLEDDYDNNVASIEIARRDLPNLALVPEKTGLNITKVMTGDTLMLTVTFTNDSPLDFTHPFVLDVSSKGIAVSENRLYREQFKGLDAGDTTSIQLSFRADGTRDTIFVSLNDDRDYGETSDEDNTLQYRLDYILPVTFLERTPTTWSFAPTLALGEYRSSYLAPDDSITLYDLPKEGDEYGFTNENLVSENPLPTEYVDSDKDNQFLLLDNRELHWSIYEMPEPATFRIPLPNDDFTTEYDIYAHRLARKSKQATTINHYQYLIEGAENWEKPVNYDQSNVYMGRIETRDDALDITISPTEIPSWNAIFSLTIIPISGTFTSPVYLIEGLETCRFQPEAELPQGTKLKYRVRIGTGDRHAPEFGQWVDVEPGDELPSVPEATVLQWRAILVGHGLTKPKLKDVVFDFSNPTVQAKAD